MGEKNLYIAYFLLFIGGWAGLHLLYIGRDAQAFLYWCTLCGYLGVGPLRDFFYLKSYIKDVNNDQDVLINLAKKIKEHEKPPISYSRVLASIIIGNSWHNMWTLAIPDELIFGFDLHFLRYFGPVISSIPAWLIGNLGREQGDFKWPLLGGLMTIPFMNLQYHYGSYGCVLSTVLFNVKAKRWRRTPYKRKGLCKRFATLGLGWLCISSVFTSYILFRAEVTYNYERVKLKDAIRNFFYSPMYTEFKSNAWMVYDDFWEYGYHQAFQNLMEKLDPTGEMHALKVLGLEKNATQPEITQRFKKLSKEWHPDRHTDMQKKEEAQSRFMDIADAYEKLSTIKKKRKRKNKEFEEEEDEDEDNYDIFVRL